MEDSRSLLDRIFQWSLLTILVLGLIILVFTETRQLTEINAIKEVSNSLVKLNTKIDENTVDSRRLAIVINENIIKVMKHDNIETNSETKTPEKVGNEKK